MMETIMPYVMLAGLAGVAWLALWGLWKLWKNYLTGDKAAQRFLRRATLAYVILTAISQIPISFWRFYDPFRSPEAAMIESILLSPLRMFQATIPILVALWLVWRVKALRAGQARDFTDPFKATPIDETVKQIFRSEQFLNALRTSLPKGEDDDKYGLDYIPFMLDSLSAKRRRFDRRANIFFW